MNPCGMALSWQKTRLPSALAFKTAQTLWQARQLCPDLVILKPHHALYQEYSNRARRIYGQYTDQVEPFGLDEAWLDVTGSQKLFGNGEQIAQQIRQRVKKELGLTVSVGVSFNKAFAKLASDMKKPDAVTVLSRENFRQLAWPLPAEALLYVGPATREKLRRHGVDTIGRLAGTPRIYLENWFGKCGAMLHDYANGLDASPVRRVSQQETVKASEIPPQRQGIYAATKMRASCFGCFAKPLPSGCGFRVGLRNHSSVSARLQSQRYGAANASGAPNIPFIGTFFSGNAAFAHTIRLSPAAAQHRSAYQRADRRQYALPDFSVCQ
jgi:nucleotidyltransferase/DNA polymerase involved in DNA repair